MDKGEDYNPWLSRTLFSMIPVAGATLWSWSPAGREQYEKVIKAKVKNRATKEKNEKEKEFAKDPLAVALEGKSIFQGELTGLIPTRPGAEFIGDITGSLIPYIRNRDLLVSSLSKPNSAQGSLFTRGALELADYLQKLPGIGKKLKFTRGVLGAVGKTTDAIVSGRYQQLAKTELS